MSVPVSAMCSVDVSGSVAKMVIGFVRFLGVRREEKEGRKEGRKG